MRPMSRRMIGGALVCAAGWLACPTAGAQSLGGGVPSLGGASLGTAGTSMGATTFSMGAMGSGLGARGSGLGAASAGAINPGPQTMPSAAMTYSPAASAAMGSLTGLPVVSSTGGVFNTPLAAPLLYGAMMQGPVAPQAQASLYNSPNGLGSTQLGLLMLATMQQTGGVGSGQLNGARGGIRPTAATGAVNPQNAKQRAANRPGGLAARYFNRTAARTAIPARYYKRQSRYYP